MHQALADILSEGDALIEDFDGTRDRLRAVPVDAVPDLLAAAEDSAHGELRGVLWYALADWQYPPALARLVVLLTDELDDVVIAGAFAIDGLAGGRFEVEKRFLNRGWPDYDGMRDTLAPEVLAWWDAGGSGVLPTVEAWSASVTSRPAPAPTSFDPNLVAWVHQHGVALTGRKAVVRDKSEVLPANQGMHLVPGAVQVDGQTERAVLLVDSDGARILAALVPDADAGWRGVTAVGAVPDFATEGVAAESAESTSS